MLRQQACEGFMALVGVAGLVARHTHIQLHGHEVHLIGTILGYVPDGQAVRMLLEAADPQVVALGVPPEDLEGLGKFALSADPASLIGSAPPPQEGSAWAAGAPGLEHMHGGVGNVPRGNDDEAPFDSLDPLAQRFLKLLEAHGDVAVPSPDLQAAYAWAMEHERPVEALDLDDDTHAEVYIRANRFRDVWRSGRINKQLAKATFEADDADQFALAWDTFQNRLPSLQAVEAAREIYMANRLQEVAKAPTVAVVPLARLEGIVARLEKLKSDGGTASASTS